MVLKWISWTHSRVFNTKEVRLTVQLCFVDSWPRLPTFRMKNALSTLDTLPTCPMLIRLSRCILTRTRIILPVCFMMLELARVSPGNNNFSFIMAHGKLHFQNSLWYRITSTSCSLHSQWEELPRFHSRPDLVLHIRGKNGNLPCAGEKVKFNVGPRFYKIPR